MEQIVDFNSGSLPKLITFTNGELLPNKAKQLQCAQFRNKQTHKLEMAIATEKFTYVGTENDTDLFYNVLAIRNRKTNKIRLIAVNTVPLNIQITKSNELLDRTLIVNKTTEQDLRKQFGTKKAKRMTEMSEKLKMDVDMIEGQLQTVVADVDVKPEDLVMKAPDENASMYRPPINRNAEDVKDVYNLYTIVDDTVLQSLTNLAEDVKEHTYGDETFTPFVADCIRECKKKHIDTIKTYQILLYIDAITKFLKLPIQSLRKKVLSLDPYPKLVVEKLLNDFTVLTAGNNARGRPISMRDKSTCYIMILGLLAMDYQLDLSSLARSVPGGHTKLLNIARSLGAQSLSSKNKLTIVLKLPLPPVQFGRKPPRK